MTMITPSYLGETIEYSSLHACRSTLEDPTTPEKITSCVPPLPNWPLAFVYNDLYSWVTAEFRLASN